MRPIKVIEAEIEKVEAEADAKVEVLRQELLSVMRKFRITCNQCQKWFTASAALTAPVYDSYTDPYSGNTRIVGRDIFCSWCGGRVNTYDQPDAAELPQEAFKGEKKR